MEAEAKEKQAYDFIQLEYQTLRKEIEETKQRLYQIVLAGITIISTAEYVTVIKMEDICLFALLLPLFVVAFGLLFISQNNAKFRAGCYIREYIEPRYKEYIEGWEGWEAWLESNNNNKFKLREVDMFIKLGFLCIIIVHYIFSVSLAYRSFENLTISGNYRNIVEVCKYFVLIFFIIIGLFFFYYLIKNAYTSTSCITPKKCTDESIVVEPEL